MCLYMNFHEYYCVDPSESDLRVSVSTRVRARTHTHTQLKCETLHTPETAITPKLVF